MKANKTKEEILKETILKDGYDQGGYERHFKFGKHTIIKAMQEYADQQTEQLKKQLEEKEKDVEFFKKLNSELSLDFQKNQAEINELKKLLSVQKLKQTTLQSQLSEKDKEIEKLEGIINEYHAYKSKVADVTLRNVRLVSELEEKDKELSELNKYKEKAILWDNLKKSDKLNSLVGGDSKFCEKVDKDKIKRLESELSELKAKHKEEIIKAYNQGEFDHHLQIKRGNRKHSFESAEQYYAQIYGK